MEDLMTVSAKNDEIADMFLTAPLIGAMVDVELRIASIANLTAIARTPEMIFARLLPFWCLEIVLIWHRAQFC